MTVLALTCILGGVALILAPRLRRTWHPARVAVVVFSMVITARYIGWRLFATLPVWDGTAFTVFCYAAVAVEALAAYAILGMMPAIIPMGNRSREVDENLGWYGANSPQVHILIPTYNESWAVLERTLVGATEQNYPNYKVWLLDDGRREWLRQRADEWGVGYITRPDNKHYKAGNVNNGIKTLRENGADLEFIAVLDADFVAWPNFVRRAMALMHDERVAIAQTPQWFYNPDLYQRKLGGVDVWPDEQRQWFDEIEPSWDAKGNALCCGTSFVMRVRALDDLNGGLPTDSVSEDSLCSLLLRGKGWKTVFLNERLTVGLAPEGLKEFLTQRARWQQGWIEIKRYFGPGNTLRSHFEHWLFLWRPVIFGCNRLLWLCVPFLYWFTGKWVMVVPAEEIISYAAPLWIDRLFWGWLYAGRRLYVVSDSHFIVQVFMNMSVTIKSILFKNPVKFTVTDKALTQSGIVVHWTTLRWLLLIGVANIAGIIYTFLVASSPAHGDAYLWGSVLLSLYSLMLVTASALPCVEGPRYRTDDRYATSEALTMVSSVGESEVRCVDISVGGVLLEQAADAHLPEHLWIEMEDVGQVKARLVRRPAPNRAAYIFESPEKRRALIRKIYCNDRYLGFPNRWSLTRALSGFLTSVFR